jgi:predicted transcriptional regulator YdeE
MDPDRARIPGLWQRFFAEGHGSDGTAGPIYGVYTGYASDASGPYTLVIGPGRTGAPPPPGFVTVRLDPGRYLVFRSRGELPEAVVAGWRAVWDYFALPGAPRRAYSTDFEVYDPGSRSEVRIHVALA